LKFRCRSQSIDNIKLFGSLPRLLFNKLNWGLDFTVVTQIEIGYQDTANLDTIRAQLALRSFQWMQWLQILVQAKMCKIRLASVKGVKPSELGD